VAEGGCGGALSVGDLGSLHGVGGWILGLCKSPWSFRNITNKSMELESQLRKSKFGF
jgi:hypothetical protein